MTIAPINDVGNFIFTFHTGSHGSFMKRKLSSNGDSAVATFRGYSNNLLMESENAEL